ncbi:MAG TPA: LPS assembly lipoprotein LptE [Nitrospiria bacterium]
MRTLSFENGCFLSFLIALGFSFWVSGCSYTVVGINPSQNFLSKRTIHFPILSNATSEPLIEERLSQLISQELLTDHRIRLVNGSQEADTILKGEITSFGETTLSFDPFQNSLEVRVSVNFNLSLESLQDEEISWETQGFQTSAEYITTNDTAATRVAKDRALREIGKNIAQTIIFQIF